jgi:hypothetical protein
MTINNSQVIEKREKKSFKGRRSDTASYSEESSGCCFGCFRGKDSGEPLMESKKNDGPRKSGGKGLK